MMEMSFINETLKMSLFPPERVKINFENTKRAPDVLAVKWKKTSKIPDQLFLATGMPPSPNTSRIVSHIWK
jgi:hypothetical protein